MARAGKARVEIEPAWILGGLLLLAAGLGSGLAGGLFGIGGGVLRIPVFVYVFPFFGVEPAVVMHLAAGTSLALAIPTCARSARAQQRAGNIDVAMLRAWLTGLLPGVALGLLLARFASARSLIGLFALLMLTVGLQMLSGGPGRPLRSGPPGRAALASVAGVIGTLSTMVGLSGGALSTAALSLLGSPIHRSIAVASAAGVAISVLGALGGVVNGLGVGGRGPLSLGYVDLPALVLMGPGVALAAPLGVRLANRLDDRRLERLFGAFLIGLAIDMGRIFWVGC